MEALSRTACVRFGFTYAQRRKKPIDSVLFRATKTLHTQYASHRARSAVLREVAGSARENRVTMASVVITRGYSLIITRYYWENITRNKNNNKESSGAVSIPRRGVCDWSVCYLRTCILARCYRRVRYCTRMKRTSGVVFICLLS